MEIDDYYELLAIHKAIMEAKFHPDPDNADVPGSPVLARVGLRVVAALANAEVERGRGDGPQRWAEWQANPKAGRFWGVAVGHAVRSVQWAGFSDGDRISFVRDLMAPFVLDEALVSEFVEAVRLRRDIGTEDGEPAP